MKNREFLFPFLLLSLLIVLFSCNLSSDSSSDSENEEDPAGGSDTPNPPNPGYYPSFFVYYKNSVFTFVIKDGTTNVTTSKMTWTVTEYDPNSEIATVSCSVVPNKTIPLGSTFYFKKASSGLDLSINGATWFRLADLKNPTNIGFIFVTKAVKPSSLYGSVKNGMEAASVSHPGGTSQGLKVFSEYDNSGSDRYTYTDYSREYYCTETGFVKAITYNYDGEDYPPFIYKREIDLTSYKIFMPDGTVIEAGETKPAAPTNLTGSYTKNADVWNGSTYEKRSYVTLSWRDNSNNEIKFNIYMKSPDDGNWYAFSTLNIGGAVLGPDSFPSNTMSGQLKRGYYMNWPVGTYSFKITAASSDLESDFSNEVVVNVSY